MYNLCNYIKEVEFVVKILTNLTKILSRQKGRDCFLSPSVRPALPWKQKQTETLQERKTTKQCLSYFTSPMKVKLLIRVQLFATPWTVAYNDPLFMGFSRQEYWSGLPFPSPEDQQIEPTWQYIKRILHNNQEKFISGNKGCFNIRKSVSVTHHSHGPKGEKGE